LKHPSSTYSRIPETSDGSGRDGDAALAFLFHPVRDRVALVHFPDLVGHARIEKDALAGRGLAGVDVGDNTEVTYCARGDSRGSWWEMGEIIKYLRLFLSGTSNHSNHKI
jgi:hypothetical protein